MQPCDLCGENTASPLIIDRGNQSWEVCWECYEKFIESEIDMVLVMMEDR